MGQTKVFEEPGMDPVKIGSCFYCCRRLPKEGNYVYWDGSAEEGGMIVLHPGCVLRWAKHLISDAMVIWHDEGRMDCGEVTVRLMDLIEQLDRCRPTR